jgi:hypothetical protein
MDMKSVPILAKRAQFLANPSLWIKKEIKPASKGSHISNSGKVK